MRPERVSNFDYQENFTDNPTLKKESRKRAIFFLKTICALFTVFVMSVFYLWELSAINQVKTNIAKFNIEQKELNQKINNLNIIIAKLSSFERIKKIATEELGMVKSTKIEYVEVDKFE